MVIPNKLLTGKLWWSQFPFHLRLITKIRFFASFGAGGVIYLTSLIFNNIGLSATEIGLGFTISAIIGTLTRIITGNYLNKTCLLYTSPSPRDQRGSRMPSSA